MLKKIVTILSILSFLLIISALIVSYAQVKTGPYVDKIIWKFMDEDVAIRELDAGKIHMVMDNLRKPENVEFAEKSPNIIIYKSVCGIFDLFVNPLPTESGFNPFSIPEVREALNYLIDREYIAKEILRGWGIPIWTHWWTTHPEYARIADFMKMLEAKYAYNFEKAKEMITRALLKVGAEFKNGKWYYKGKPIVIKFFIRTEDVRRQIGDYIAELLEKLGFTVERIYGPAKKAIPVVYFGDPRKGEWHLYTEGWAYTGITAYADEDPEFFYVSHWSGEVFRYYGPEYRPEPMIIELSERLARGEYRSIEERESWIKRIIEMELKDAVRVWLVARICPFVTYKTVKNVAYDLVAGFWTPFTLRTVNLEGKIGGTLTITDIRAFVASAWNPIGGETWLYDIVKTQLIWDSGAWVHPHTGKYIPVRVVFKVETAGPEGKLKVPSDAMIWDVKERIWKKGVYKEATSKITARLILGKWHHGIDIDMNDVLTSVALVIDVCSSDSPIYDSAACDPIDATFTEKFRGIRIVNANTIEIYIDYWHIDKTYIGRFADYAWPRLPWEVVALLYKAVIDKKLAFSESRAKEWGVEWIDLSKGPTLDILKEYLDKAIEESYVPPYLKGKVSPEEARRRYEAVKKFYETYHHFYISNGPFKLVKIDPVAQVAEFEAFREGYPLPVGYFDWLVKPKIPEIVISFPKTVVPGLPMVINITSTFEGKPYSKIAVLKALVIDPATGKVIAVEEGKLVKPEAGLFSIEFSGKETAFLKPGTYKIMVIAVGAEAAVPEFKEYTVEAIPPIVHFERMLKSAISDIRSEIDVRISELRSSIEDLRGRIEGVSASISSIQGIAYAAIALAIIAIAIAAASFARRRS